MVNAGTGIELTYESLTVRSITRAVKKVFEEEYQHNAKLLSKLFQDQPEKPAKRAAFWIEWLLRNADEVDKIKLPSLGWFQANSYDVVLFSVSLVFFSVLFVKIAIFKCFRLIFGKNKKEKKD